jgi:hypothetical protein
MPSDRPHSLLTCLWLRCVKPVFFATRWGSYQLNTCIMPRLCCSILLASILHLSCCLAAGDDTTRAVSFHEERSTQIAMFKKAVS